MQFRAETFLPRETGVYFCLQLAHFNEVIVSLHSSFFFSTWNAISRTGLITETPAIQWFMQI